MLQDVRNSAQHTKGLQHHMLMLQCQHFTYRGKKHAHFKYTYIHT
jgi:hypothetical protein